MNNCWMDDVENAIELMEKAKQLIKPYLASIKKHAPSRARMAEDMFTYSLEHAEQTLPMLIELFQRFQAKLTPEIIVQWYADPYLALQKLTRTAKDDALIYLLCNLHKGKVHYAKETKADLLKEDLFAKTTESILHHFKFRPFIIPNKERDLNMPSPYYD